MMSVQILHFNPDQIHILVYHLQRRWPRRKQLTANEISVEQLVHAAVLYLLRVHAGLQSTHTSFLAHSDTFVRRCARSRNQVVFRPQLDRRPPSLEVRKAMLMLARSSSSHHRYGEHSHRKIAPLVTKITYIKMDPRCTRLFHAAIEDRGFPRTQQQPLSSNPAFVSW